MAKTPRTPLVTVRLSITDLSWIFAALNLSVMNRNKDAREAITRVRDKAAARLRELGLDEDMIAKLTWRGKQ